MALLSRMVAFLLLIGVALPPPAAAAAGPPLRLIVMEPEIDGETSDLGRRDEWRERLALLADRVSKDLSELDLYEVLDPSAAQATFEKHRRRADVHACEVCALEVAEATGAERVLSLWVFRMSSLVLTLHGMIRNGEDGSVLYASAIDFRGDNDRSWLRAADHLVRDLAATPAGRR